MDLPNDLLEGSRVALENTRRLIACADAIAERGEYGPANSLLILAIEECSKAGFLSACRIAGEPPGGYQDLVKVLRMHKFKQYFGLVICLTSDTMDKIAQEPNFVTSLESRFKDIDQLDGEKVLKRFEEVVCELTPEVMSRVRAEISETESIGTRQWWRTASIVRNRGFYIDWEDEKWQTPARIQRSDYEKTKVTVEKLLTEVENIKIKSPQGLELFRRIIRASVLEESDLLPELSDDFLLRS